MGIFHEGLVTKIFHEFYTGVSNGPASEVFCMLKYKF